MIPDVLQVLWGDVDGGVCALCCACGLGARWTQQHHLPVEQRLLHRSAHSNKIKQKPLDFIYCFYFAVPVLLDLRKRFHVGQTQPSEGGCEEQEQGNLLDRTPTPTSLEVR